jgi:hypothetical protein
MRELAQARLGALVHADKFCRLQRLVSGSEHVAYDLMQSWGNTLSRAGEGDAGCRMPEWGWRLPHACQLVA